MTDKEEYWRAVLVSTKDIAYRNRTVDIISEKDSVSIPIPDDEVLCNGCNDNIHPENGWLMEYKDTDGISLPASKGEEGWDEEGWKTYDIYCETCQEKYFPDAQKCVVDVSGTLST